jgi:hypothetical protein
VDCDIIAVSDIVEPWKKDSRDCLSGAVEEDGNFSRAKIKLRKMKQIHLPENKHYDNTRV